MQTNESDMKKKIDEAGGSVAKLKESVQTALKKVKEEFTALKTDTEILHKEVKSI